MHSSGSDGYSSVRRLMQLTRILLLTFVKTDGEGCLSERAMRESISRGYIRLYTPCHLDGTSAADLSSLLKSLNTHNLISASCRNFGGIINPKAPVFEFWQTLL